MAEQQSPTRRPYTGSCHCAAVKYVASLTFPHSQRTLQTWREKGQRFYRCNCTLCHKFGKFHVRLNSPHDDFLVFSPVDLGELGQYQCNSKIHTTYFCKNCGGQPFTIGGPGEVTEVDVSEIGLSTGQLQKLGVDGSGKARVWRPAKAFCEDLHLPPGKTRDYLSVNGYSLDAGQGLDLADWTDKKWVVYLDALTEKRDHSLERPREGGAY